MSNNEVQVEAEKEEDQCRNEENMKSKEPAESRPARRIAGEDETPKPVADERRPPRLFRGDDYCPKTRLVPTQKLPGEGHSQREEKQRDAGEPPHLSRVFVSAKQIDPDGVNSDKNDHGRGAKIMNAAHETAEPRAVDEDQGVICLPRAGHICAGQ